MFTKSIIISIIAAISYALPSGSPYCQIEDSNRASFESNHGKESATPVFDAKFTSENGGYKISLTGKDTPIHGALLYVVGSDSKTHLGQFTPKTGFKFVDGCTGGSGSTITHESSGVKQDTEFIWTPGSNDQGPFTLHAVVTGNKSPWQMFTINAAQGNGSSQTDNPPSGENIPKEDPYGELPNFGDMKIEETESQVSTTTASKPKKATQTAQATNQAVYSNKTYDSQSTAGDIPFSGVQSNDQVAFLFSLSTLVLVMLT